MAENTDLASDEDGASGSATEAERWLAKIEKAQSDFRDWLSRADKVAKIYASEQSDAAARQRMYAMLWANTEVLKPTVYSRPPQPVVTRRFRDRDPVARQVADVMERALVSQFELNDIHDILLDVRDDFILVSRGAAWVRYDAEFENEDDRDQVTGENVLFDHVHYSDLIHPMRRKWRDLPWVCRRVHMDDNQLKKRFGEETFKKLKASKETALATRNDRRATAGEIGGRNPDTTEVYELWDKVSKKVYWLVKGFKETLDKRDPPLKLRGFFPTPKPAYGTLPTDKLTPVPDYRYYQDQAQEINDLTEKIATLTDSLKLVGWYPAAMDGGVSEALEKAAAPNNKDMLVPVAGWQQFTTSGGSGNLIQWWPVDIVIQAIAGAIEVRRQIIQDIFQITGISDIVRGESDPRETLGAQELKSQFGAVRVRGKQSEMQRYVADLTKLAAEIIAELFDQKTLQDMTGIQLPTQADAELQRARAALAQTAALPGPGAGLVPAAAVPSGANPSGNPQIGQQNGISAMVPGMEPQPPAGGQGADEGILSAPDQDPTQEQVTWEQVIALMRDDRMRGYRVEIETDSTIEADESREREERNQLIEVIAGFLERIGPILQQAPTLGRMLGELMMFQLRAYRIGRPLEQIIEETVDQMIKEALEGASEPEEPEAVQVERLRAEAKMQAEQFGAELDQMRLQNEQRLNDQKMDLERKKAAIALQNDRDRMEQEIALKRADMQARQELEIMKLHADGQTQEKKIAAEAQLKQKLERMRQNPDEVTDDDVQAARDMALAVVEAMTAPRIVVRDENGEIVGSEVVGAGQRPDIDDDADVTDVLAILKAPREVVRDEGGQIVGSRVVDATQTGE